MMRAAPLVLWVLFSCGCLVSSLHPIYDDRSIVFDEALLGVWENTESEITVTVSRGEWRSYGIAYTDRFGTTKFTGHLTTIGTARFLDVIAADGLEKPAFVVATNGVMQIRVDGAAVHVREPDYATVLERVSADTLGIAAASDMKQNVIVTAATAPLRAWLAASLKDPALWAEWKTFTRSAR